MFSTVKKFAHVVHCMCKGRDVFRFLQFLFRSNSSRHILGFSYRWCFSNATSLCYQSDCCSTLPDFQVFQVSTKVNSTPTGDYFVQHDLLLNHIQCCTVYKKILYNYCQKLQVDLTSSSHSNSELINHLIRRFLVQYR